MARVVLAGRQGQGEHAPHGMLPSPREPDLWALFRPRQLRAAKVQVFVDFLAQIVQDALMRIDYQL